MSKEARKTFSLGSMIVVIVLLYSFHRERKPDLG